MARALTDFIGIHKDETAWVFGKGPSLDKFNMADAGPLRCAINDVVKAVPDCRYCFANDSIHAWKQVYRPTHILFSPARTIQDAFLDPATAPELISYPDAHDEMRLKWSAKQMARDGLAILPGTLNSAIQILYVMGVAKLVCVGIDGGNAHAKSHQWGTRLRMESGRDYDRIRNRFLQTAGMLRMEVEFFSDTPPPNATESLIPPDPMILAEVISGTFLRGSPLRVGAILSLTPDDFRELSHSGRVRRYIAPVKPAVVAPPPAPVVEVAAFARPVAETADAMPKIRRRPLRAK